MVGNTEEYNYGVGISLNDRSKENSIKWNYATCTGPPGVACADKGAYFDYSCADSNYVNLQGNGFGNTKETDCEYVDEADSSTRSGDSSGGGGASDDSSTRTVEVYVGNFYCCHKWAGFSGKGYHWKKSCPNKWNWNRNKYHECDKHESCSAFCDSKKGDGVASRSEILTSGKDRCRCYSIEER